MYKKCVAATWKRLRKTAQKDKIDHSIIYRNSISSTFYEQLLRLQIPKVLKKDCQVVNILYAFGIYERKSFT